MWIYVYIYIYTCVYIYIYIYIYICDNNIVTITITVSVYIYIYRERERSYVIYHISYIIHNIPYIIYHTSCIIYHIHSCTHLYISIVVYDFGGFDSGGILTSRGGVLMSAGDFPEVFESTNLNGDSLSRESQGFRPGQVPISEGRVSPPRPRDSPRGSVSTGGLGEVFMVRTSGKWHTLSHVNT